MSKRKSPSKRTRETAKSRGGGSESRGGKDGQKAPSAPPAKGRFPSPAAIRETIESVVIAFVLAFLFRTFEAEAFVIPTGSMAPTLMGRHKDVRCPKCGYWYQASASEEVDSNTNVERGEWVEECTCPMCRYTMDLTEDGRLPGKKVLEKYPSFKGDRILVGKFWYQLSEPERWDVAVFKWPGEAKTNFIKRVVGLPNELIFIWRGDIFAGPLPDDEQLPDDLDRLQPARQLKVLREWTAITRKPPHKLLAMLQPVYDNDYVLPELTKLGWLPRWQPWPPGEGSLAGAWRISPEDYRSFETGGRGEGETWLRYQHIVPPDGRWKERKDGTPDAIPRLQLISDFSAYNTSRSRGERRPGPDDSAGLHWVGDLAVQCTLEARSQSGEAIFELVEGGWRFRCRIDVATGTATLEAVSADGQPAHTLDGGDYLLTAQTDVCGPGEHELIFSNCDDQLRLWVDGSLVLFGDDDSATCYAPLDNVRPQNRSFASDYLPVGIGSQGAALRVSHLKVLRDIYYIADKQDDSDPYPNGPITDFRRIPVSPEILADERLWEAFDDTKLAPFRLEADQFLVLGDNSPKSKDSRLWHGFEYYVKRELLIGKALYIYWPHSWNKVPWVNIPFPLFPNFARMGFVR